MTIASSLVAAEPAVVAAERPRLLLEGDLVPQRCGRWLQRIGVACVVWAACPGASATAAQICVRRAENNGLMNIIPSHVIIRSVGQQGSEQQVSIAGGERKCIEVRAGDWDIEARSRRPYDPSAKDENECRSNTIGVVVNEGQTIVIAISPRSRRSAYLCGWTVREAAGRPSATVRAARDVPTKDSSPQSPRGVRMVGDLTPQEVDAISEVVKQVDALPLLSIVRRTDDVAAMTGSICGALCGSGNVLILRKVDGRWKVVRSSKWVS